MTLKDAKKELKAIGITITYNRLCEDYRVNFVAPAREETAYYTNDLQDAVNTGKAMVRKQLPNGVVALTVNDVVNGALFDLLGE